MCIENFCMLICNFKKSQIYFTHLKRLSLKTLFGLIKKTRGISSKYGLPLVGYNTDVNLKSTASV